MIIIIGKSGSGKSTVVDELTKLGYKKVLTDTTRPMRPGEVQGVDYNFLSQEEFDLNKENGVYAEDVVYNASFGQVSYGSRKEDYLNSDDKSVIILNPYGLLMADENDCLNHVFKVYLRLTDELILERLSKRGDSMKEVQRRLLTDEVDFANMESHCDLVIDITKDMTPEYVAKLILEKKQKKNRKKGTMKIVFVLDQKNGMMFNHRRQSFDQAIIKKIVEDVNEVKGRLWLSNYSKDLFTSYDVNVMPLEEFDLTKANDNDVVYVENIDVDLEAMIADKEASIELNFYRWDKVYPSDKKMIFTKELLDAFFVKDSYEMSGETHDVISVEIWEKNKK